MTNFLKSWYKPAISQFFGETQWPKDCNSFNPHFGEVFRYQKNWKSFCSYSPFCSTIMVKLSFTKTLNQYVIFYFIWFYIYFYRENGLRQVTVCCLVEILHMNFWYHLYDPKLLKLTKAVNLVSRINEFIKSFVLIYIIGLFGLQTPHTTNFPWRIY